MDFQSALLIAKCYGMPQGEKGRERFYLCAFILARCADGERCLHPTRSLHKDQILQILWKASLHPIGAMGRILKYAISFFQKAVLVRGEAEPKKEGGMILSRPL